MSTKIQPTPMHLFSASLEAHMTAYTDEIKQNLLNQEFQLAQNRILREGQLSNLSQADLMNRLNALREQLTNDLKDTTIPLSKTNAPENIQQGYTSAEYAAFTDKAFNRQENKKRQNKEVIKAQKDTGLDFLEPKKTTPKTINKPTISKDEINNILSKFEKKPKATNKALDDEINKNLNKILKNPNVSNAFIYELKNRVINPNLISTETKTKAEKRITPLKAELLAKVEQLAKDKKIKEETINNALSGIINKIEKTLSESPISSTSATTASSTASVEPVEREYFTRAKKETLNLLKKHDLLNEYNINKFNTISKLNKLKSYVLKNYGGEGLKNKKK